MVASTASRIRAAGRDQVAPYRFSTWGLIWLPSPSRNRPLLSSCRSYAACARCIGLRGVAIATLVIRSTSTPAVAAATSGKNTSCGPSKVNSPSTPVVASSAARAAAASGRASSWMSRSTG